MIILDTTVLIDILRGKDSINEKIKTDSSKEYSISAISIQELYVGVGYLRLKKGPEIAKKLENDIEKFLQDFKILNLSWEILRTAGIWEGEMRAQGKNIDYQDYIVAATAESISAEKILTRNANHFKNLKIPFEGY
jgi:predicted nucleic acid-binding protein